MKKRIRDNSLAICRAIDTEFHNRILNKYSFLRRSGHFPALIFKRAYARRTNRVQRGYNYSASFINVLYAYHNLSLSYPFTLKFETMVLDILINQLSTRSYQTYSGRHPANRPLPLSLSGSRFAPFLHARLNFNVFYPFKPVVSDTLNSKVLVLDRENRVRHQEIRTLKSKEQAATPFLMRSIALSQRFFTNISLRTTGLKNSLKAFSQEVYAAPVERQTGNPIKKDLESVDLGHYTRSGRHSADSPLPLSLSGNKFTFFKKNTRTTNLNCVYRDSSFNLTTPEILFSNNTDRFQKEIQKTRKVILETRKELQEKIMSRHSIKEEIEQHVNNRLDINRIVDIVYSELTRRIRLERERRGFYA